MSEKTVSDLLKELEAKEQSIDGKKEAPTPKSKKIQEARELLELKRLKIEDAELDARLLSIKAGASQDNNLFTKLLDMEKAHNTDMLNMTKENFDTKLEMEKLKVADGGEDSTLTLLKMFAPYTPLLLKAFAQSPTSKKEGERALSHVDTTAKAPSLKGVKKKEVVKMSYEEQIKKGLITVEEAWKLFKKVEPKKAMLLGKERFKIEFQKIKDSK